MPNGEENVTNSILEMMHADRHTVGHYRCTADNRVGQPDTRDIFVNVLCKYFYFIFFPFKSNRIRSIKLTNDLTRNANFYNYSEFTTNKIHFALRKVEH